MRARFGDLGAALLTFSDLVLTTRTGPSHNDRCHSPPAQPNYYDGAITGHINTGTIHAIEYLQRAAGIPQTGSMNVATQNALASQLAHGDNQMGS